jgi:hypothetical protein
LQDFNYTCPIKEARAHDLACPIKEAKALNIKIDSKNTIIIYIFKGSNLVKGSKSHINLTSYINFIALRKKDKIKAKKANRAKLRD